MPTHDALQTGTLCVWSESGFTEETRSAPIPDAVTNIARSAMAHMRQSSIAITVSRRQTGARHVRQDVRRRIRSDTTRASRYRRTAVCGGIGTSPGIRGSNVLILNSAFTGPAERLNGTSPPKRWKPLASAHGAVPQPQTSCELMTASGAPRSHHYVDVPRPHRFVSIKQAQIQRLDYT